MARAQAQNGKLLSKVPVNLSQTPAWKAISENDSLKPAYKHLQTLEFYNITYQSDSLEVAGMLVEPKAEGKYPVVIFNRGGNRTLDALSAKTLIMYTSKLAAQGYVVIGSNYRDKDEFGGADVNDVLNLVPTLTYLPKANRKRIGMFGWSRGGMMTYLALKNSRQIKTAVVGNGPSDLFGIIADRPEMETGVMAQCIPNYATHKQAELEKRSALYWPEQLNPKSSLLILCGSFDTRVNPQQSEKMATKLTEIGYNVSFKKVETDHFFSDKKVELDSLVIAWFNQKLK